MGDHCFGNCRIRLCEAQFGLKILGRRDDGFHDILSVFQTIDLCDRLVFKPAGQGRIILSCDDADLSVGPDNLVYQAVLAFRDYTGMDRGVEIALEKRIPMAAGLGGGSSDAAAVLRVLNRAWEAGLSSGELREIGASLGSDVPFFVRQKGTAIVGGRGEKLRYVPWSADVVYVLICPGFQVHTGWAFANYKKTLTGHGEYDSFLNSVKNLPVSGFFERIENDFFASDCSIASGNARYFVAVDRRWRDGCVDVWQWFHALRCF